MAEKRVGYVMVEWPDRVVAGPCDTLEEIVLGWDGGRSLRLQTVSGEIVDVSAADYRRASEIAPRRVSSGGHG